MGLSVRTNKRPRRTFAMTTKGGGSKRDTVGSVAQGRTDRDKGKVRIKKRQWAD